MRSPLVVGIVMLIVLGLAPFMLKGWLLKNQSFVFCAFTMDMKKEKKTYMNDLYRIAMIGMWIMFLLTMSLLACLAFATHYSDDTMAILASCFGGSIVGTITFGLLAWLEKQNLK